MLLASRLTPPGSEMGRTVAAAGGSGRAPPARGAEPAVRRRDEHLGGGDDDLVVAAAGVVALAQDEGEQHDADDGAGGLELLVGRAAASARSSGSGIRGLVHERGVEGDRLDELARVVVLGLLRRQHHVLGALAAHLDGEADGLAHDAAQLAVDLVLEVGGRRQDLGQGVEHGLHDRLGVLVALLLEAGAAREQGQRDGAPLAHGVRWADLEELLLELLELLALLAVHAEEVAGEDELPDHGHGHAHEDVAAADAVVEEAVDVGAVEDGVVEPVDQLLVAELRRQAAGAHIAELGEAQHPLLHVGAQLLAAVVEVVDVVDVEEVRVVDRAGLGEDLLLQVADLGRGGLELGAQLGELGVLVVQLAGGLGGGVAGQLELAGGLGVAGLEPAHLVVVLDGDGRGGAAQALVGLLQAVNDLIGLLEHALERLDLGVALGQRGGAAVGERRLGLGAGFGEHAVLGQQLLDTGFELEHLHALPPAHAVRTRRRPRRADAALAKAILGPESGQHWRIEWNWEIKR
ncbi:2e43d6ac-0f84-424e-a3de-dddb76ad11d0 [Thermothielavioides terrestris]|uniref:2e43d6ac-0f84-424e-a3de-dddb76ad11d0 n=1 Tax=Thermothielavioides terrestris TaxID=2587410 RepID=A0A446B709_9PEZI|nr:2e43d6ac-0f84-424e-a3de-dddb76ad11d0 [Thermothielavioides terrestris]